MSEAATHAAIIVAGGTGSRTGRDGGKQLALLAGRPVMAWALAALGEAPLFGSIVVVGDSAALPEFESAVAEPLPSGATVVVVAGGSTRQESVAAGLSAIPDGVTTILVHDGARPLVTAQLLESATRFLETSGADGVIVGHPSVDTLKVVDDGRVVETPDRGALWAIQTPQVFDAAVLRRAHTSALEDDFQGTDDASLVERIGGRVLVLEGPRDNIKITVPEDFAYADTLLRQRWKGEVRL